MADRHNTDTPRRVENFDNSPKSHLAKPNAGAPHDDVIASLANAPENRRARQVSEWERLRSKALRAAA